MSHSLLIEDAVLETRRPSNDSDRVDVITYALLNLGVRPVTIVLFCDISCLCFIFNNEPV